MYSAAILSGGKELNAPKGHEIMWASEQMLRKGESVSHACNRNMSTGYFKR
jgi:hypothetical protein